MTLHVVTTAPDYLPHVGGAEVGLHTLVTRSAARHDVRNSVVTPTTDSSAIGVTKVDDVDVVRYRRPRRSVRWLAPTAAATTRSPRIIRSLAPDVVHASYALPTGLGAAFAASRLGVPLVFTLGGNDVIDPLYPPPEALRRLAAVAVRRSDHVFCFSTPVQATVIERWGVDPDRTSVNPFGVDVDRFRPRPESRPELLARWGCSADRPVVVALQRLARRKGVDLLLAAIAELRTRDVQVLIGGRGPAATELHEQAAALGLGKQVRFLGFVNEEDKPGLLSLADLFVVPSRYEGQGIAIAEAAACQTAVVATASGGTVDMVDDGVSGWLVAPDKHSIAEAIDTALSDRDLVARAGRAGRQKVVSTLSLDMTSDRFVQKLCEVVGS